MVQLLVVLSLCGAAPAVSSASALTCDAYTDLRVARFEGGAEHAVAACLRRVAQHGGACPDARLATRLATLHRDGARAIERRCPGSDGESVIAAAEAGVLCRTLAVCPPTPTPSFTPSPAPSGPRPRFDAGWTGIAHELSVPSAASATAVLTNCDGTIDTVCDLFAATTGSPFGPPAPMTAGGVATCVTIAFASDMTGTLDVATGDLTESSALRVSYYLGDLIDRPCPVCVAADGDPQLGEAGTCESGPNDGDPCTVHALAHPGYGRNRATSSDCAPDPTRLIGDYVTPLRATTGTSSFGTTAASPKCSAQAGAQCLCNTCNTAETITCTANADCPESGGAPGICGGRRCLGGPNLGTPCVANSACPNSICAQPGEPTRPSGCLADEDGSLPPFATACLPVSSEVGTCQSGPLDTICAFQPHRGCSIDADCQPPNGNVADDVCIARTRPCFLDPILATGIPDVPSGGVAHPLLAGSLCLAPTRSSAQNTVAGFSGPARIVFPLELTIAP